MCQPAALKQWTEFRKLNGPIYAKRLKESLGRKPTGKEVLDVVLVEWKDLKNLCVTTTSSSNPDVQGGNREGQTQNDEKKGTEQNTDSESDDEHDDDNDDADFNEPIPPTKRHKGSSVDNKSTEDSDSDQDQSTSESSKDGNLPATIEDTDGFESPSKELPRRRPNIKITPRHKSKHHVDENTAGGNKSGSHKNTSDDSRKKNDNQSTGSIGEDHPKQKEQAIKTDHRRSESQPTKPPPPPQPLQQRKLVGCDL